MVINQPELLNKIFFRSSPLDVLTDTNSRTNIELHDVTELLGLIEVGLELCMTNLQNSNGLILSVSSGIKLPFIKLYKEILFKSSYNFHDSSFNKFSTYSLIAKLLCYIEKCCKYHRAVDNIINLWLIFGNCGG